MYIRSNCTSLSYEINNKKRTEQKNIAYVALLRPKNKPQSDVVILF